MARNRSGQSLIDDAYKMADLEAFTDRYPRTEVLRYINQGGAELWDIILTAQGKAFGRSSTPWSITTTADTTSYSSSFPSTFLSLLSVRLDGDQGEKLRPLTDAEEAWHLQTGATGTYPLFYELVPGGLRLLPKHSAGLTVIVDFAICFADLSDSSGSNFDGVNGWEQYMVCYAAREMAKKEGEPDEVRERNAEMHELQKRILVRAGKRDAFRPKRARDVRGEQIFGRGRFPYGRFSR